MIRSTLAALLLTAGAAAAQPPGLPPPPKEAAWLQNFVGEWETEAESVAVPGMPAMKCNGTAKAKSLGGYWVISENEMKPMGMKVSAVFQVGYDTEKKKYVGTWIDSMTNHMWHYTGTLEGNVLTLEAEGPTFTDPKKKTLFKDVYEFTGPDAAVLKSTIKGDDGKWTAFMTATYKRKK
jgi:hypothetical protein